MTWTSGRESEAPAGDKETLPKSYQLRIRVSAVRSGDDGVAANSGESCHVLLLDVQAENRPTNYGPITHRVPRAPKLMGISKAFHLYSV